MAMAHDHQARQGALSLPAISLASSEMVTRPRRQCNSATLHQCHCAPRRFPKTNGQPRVIIYHWPAAGHERELLCALQRSTARTETVLPARQCRQFPAAVAFCTQSASGRTANAAQSNWYLLLYLVYDNAADLLHSASNALHYYVLNNISAKVRHEKVFCCCSYVTVACFMAQNSINI